MNKILKYSLGVLYCMLSSVAYAVDKFDVLPDLPDPLTYAVPAAEAAAISGNTTTPVALGTQSIGSEPNFVSVLLSLVFVVLLIYLTGIIYAKLNKVGFKTLKRQQGEFSKSHVSVVSTTQLGNNKTLHVVELDGKRMLIGASSGAIQLIKDLGSVNQQYDEEFSHIEIPNIKIPKIEIPKIEIPTIGFSKMVTKTHKPIEEFEKQEPQVDNNDNLSNSDEPELNVAESVVENPEGIIDSLFSQPEDVVQDEVVEKTTSEHMVDPDDFALYKKYLG